MPANLSPLQPWYVCLTKPRREALAVRKLEEQGYGGFPAHAQPMGKDQGRLD